MKLLQINTTLNTTSTGRITEEIGIKAMEYGYDSYAAFRKLGPAGSKSKKIKIGNEFDRYIHGLNTRVFDRHGFSSQNATKKLVKQIKQVDPDVIGLHNLHGYYLNVEILFQYLKKVQKPVVWTFHDCWPFTGHCVYFDRVGCEKWKKQCYSCPQKKKYPASYLVDNSKNNFSKKRELFTGLENLTIITPSGWLKDLVKKSFLKEYPVRVIHNGIDLKVFKPRTDQLPAELNNLEAKIILGVASVWDERKGLKDFLKLADSLDKKYKIVLVGLNRKQIAKLPDNILGIERTENVEQLSSLYSKADVFVNPTWSDNFPTTNIESLACGTPVVTYRTGGSPEAIDSETGIVINQGDVQQLTKAIQNICSKGKKSYQYKCRKRATELFDKEKRYYDYVNLYRYITESGLTKIQNGSPALNSESKSK